MIADYPFKNGLREKAVFRRTGKRLFKGVSYPGLQRLPLMAVIR